MKRAGTRNIFFFFTWPKTFIGLFEMTHLQKHKRSRFNDSMSLPVFLTLFPLLLSFCCESYQPCYIFLFKGLTDNAIKNLAFCCRLLRTLNLAGCSKVTIQCVAIFFKRDPLVCVLGDMLSRLPIPH